DDPGRQEALQVLKLAHPGIFLPANIFSIDPPLWDAFGAVLDGDQTTQAALDGAAQKMQSNLDRAWTTWNEIGCRAAGRRRSGMDLTRALDRPAPSDEPEEQSGRRLRHRPRGRIARKEQRAGFLFASPWLLGLILFTVGPLIASVLLSLTNWNLISSPRFLGV